MAATHTLIFIVCLAWLLLLIVVLLLLLLLLMVVLLLLLLLRLLSKQINKKIGMNDLLTLNRDPLEKEKIKSISFEKIKMIELGKFCHFDVDFEFYHLLFSFFIYHPLSY